MNTKLLQIGKSQRNSLEISIVHVGQLALCVRSVHIYVSDLLTYLLTPWSRVLLEKLTGFAANQEIPRILWNTPKVHYRTHKRPLPSP